MEEHVVSAAFAEDLVEASLTGSIIGNVLLVFGAAAFVGGLKHRTQHFNRTAAGSSPRCFTGSHAAAAAAWS